MSRSRNYVFTLNNPENALAITDFNGATFLTYQLESGESGTQHYQGYVEFSEAKSLRCVRAMLPRAHFEPRRGSQQQAIDYCQKSETRLLGPFTEGEPKKQGKRSDLDEIRQKLIEGATLESIADSYFGSWCRYRNSFNNYRSLKQPSRTWKSEVFLLYGPPGTGKSRYALESCPTSEQYWKQRSNWWDLYEAHPTVVIDDYYGWLPWDVLLRILDRYPLLVETKGGQTQFLARKIFITTNLKPDKWYKDSPNFKALTRRIEHWIYMKDENTKVELPNWEMFNKATS